MKSASKKSLQEIAKSVKVHEYLDHKEYLAKLYQLMKDEGPYSYLQMADDLGFGKINMIRLVIADQRPLTRKAAQRIATALDIHGSERRYFTTLVDYIHERKAPERDRLFVLLMQYKSQLSAETLDVNQAQYFSEWFNPVIREMMALDDFQPDPDWIRKRISFPIHLSEVKAALDLLVSLGYVALNPKTGKYVRKRGKIHTPPEVDSLALIRYHQKMMELGREAITRVGEDMREIGALTVSVPAAAVPIMKEKIRKMMDEIEGMEAADGEREVFQLNVQLFPFTRSKP